MKIRMLGRGRLGSAGSTEAGYPSAWTIGRAATPDDLVDTAADVHDPLFKEA